jgi:hypothetical protein
MINQIDHPALLRLLGIETPKSFVRRRSVPARLHWQPAAGLMTQLESEMKERTNRLPQFAD